MGLQGGFHLERPDAVPGAFDHVVGSTDKPVVAVLILPGQIPGVVIVVGHAPICRLFVAVIAAEQSNRPFGADAADDDVSFGSDRAGGMPSSSTMSI